MGDDDLEPDFTHDRWRGWMAAVGALLTAAILVGLVMMVTASNRARETALASERHSYDVMLLTRTVDATIARSEAALGRYVLDEEPATGNLYYSEWQAAGRQIGELERLVRGDAEQSALIARLRTLYAARGRELSVPAAAAAGGRGTGGLSFFYAAGRSATGPDLRGALTAIAAAERTLLRSRMLVTRRSSEQADRLAGWLGWLAALIGLGALVVGMAAWRAVGERLAALREADSEADRARLLDEAVRERTGELLAANQRLETEAADREAAEARLRQVQKMEAVGQLTGGIAHDFNNMLAVVFGGLDLARRKLSGSRREVEFHLDNAMEGATRAAALTRRLLAFARAEPLLTVSAAPAALIENMLDLIDRSIGERIQVSTCFPDEPWYVEVDPSQLENALLNLAVNARDAMEGEGRLSLIVENRVLAEREIGDLSAGEHVRIALTDDGAGMGPDVLERVFEPFFTTKEVGKGTGLGLSQIFAFARQSRGDVVIESAPGVGTTVAIWLPRAAAPPAVESEEARGTSAMARHSAVPILVVEDDPRVGRATVAALEELGYRPISSSSAQEGLAILAQNGGIKLVITDVMMPGMTGPEMVREATRLYPEIAILYVTGYVGDAGEGQDLTGFALLRKPFTVVQLGDAVAAALGRLPPQRNAA